jgi:hypothetical protein
LRGISHLWELGSPPWPLGDFGQCWPIFMVRYGMPRRSDAQWESVP